MHQYICILLNCVYPSGREWSAPPVDPCRLTTRENSDSTSRSFVTPNTFDFGENGVYQPVRIKGYLSLGVSICRVYFSARELLRRNFQRGRARGISRMECPAFGISLFLSFFLLRISNCAPFPSKRPIIRFTHFRIGSFEAYLSFEIGPRIGHSKITGYWDFRVSNWNQFFDLMFLYDAILALFVKKITDTSSNKIRHYQIFNYKKIEESFEIFQTFSVDLFKIISPMLIISLRTVLVSSRVGKRVSFKK